MEKRLLLGLEFAGFVGERVGVGVGEFRIAGDAVESGGGGEGIDFPHDVERGGFLLGGAFLQSGLPCLAEKLVGLFDVGGVHYFVHHGGGNADGVEDGAVFGELGAVAEMLEGCSARADDGEGEDGEEGVALFRAADGEPIAPELFPIGVGCDVGKLEGEILREAVGGGLHGFLGVFDGADGCRGRGCSDGGAGERIENAGFVEDSGKSGEFSADDFESDLCEDNLFGCL